MRTFIGSRLSALLASSAAVLVATAGVAAPAYAGGGAPAPGSAGLGDRLYPLLGNGGGGVQGLPLRGASPPPEPRHRARPASGTGCIPYSVTAGTTYRTTTSGCSTPRRIRSRR